VSVHGTSLNIGRVSENITVLRQNPDNISV
jgi:hypothetical protein